ncbi:MAG: Adenylate cyclase [Verrucomicrobia bacterium]|nr:Adenylate cyclase [Verrucomicrobiota bacterium]
MQTWIQRNDGTRIPIDAHCAFGRAQRNAVRLDSPAASRKHAYIHAQQSETGPEFWLADLGSTNGTLRNGKRLTIPTRLGDGDVITILEESFVFHTEHHLGVTSRTQEPPTVAVRGLQLCWLLMVDIVQFTALSREQEPDALGVLVGAWIRDCRDAIEENGGTIDKFLGDALFAYWPDAPEMPARVAATLGQLRRRQAQQAPTFRIVLHHGRGVVQGSAGGANNLSGPEIIAVFRLEKLCAKLGARAIVSAPAVAALGTAMTFSPLGEHPLDGFPGLHAVFGLR